MALLAIVLAKMIVSRIAKSSIAHILIMFTFVVQSRLFEAIDARAGLIGTPPLYLTAHSSHSLIVRYSDSNGVRNCALGTEDHG